MQAVHFTNVDSMGDVSEKVGVEAQELRQGWASAVRLRNDIEDLGTAKFVQSVA